REPNGLGVQDVLTKSRLREGLRCLGALLAPQGRAARRALPSGSSTKREHSTMPTAAPDHGLKIFSTCPPSALAQPRTCIRQLQEISRWSEDAGCEGMLLFTEHAVLDPLLVSRV